MTPTAAQRRAALGQPASATQGMIDYWRDQYRDYSKDLDALWNRLRPGFYQPPPAGAAPPVPTAAPARSVGQVEAGLAALYRAINKEDLDYMDEAARLKAERAAGWPGAAEWRRRQLEEGYAESQARLYAAFMERRLALLAKVKAELLEKERAVRALTSKVRDGTLTATEYRLISAEDRAWVASKWRPEWKARLAAELEDITWAPVSTETAAWAKGAAAALVPRPTAPAPAAGPPVWFEELKTLARNYEGALAQAGRLPLGTPARARADAEVARSARDFKDHFDSRAGGMSEKERGDLFWEFMRWAYGGSARVPHMVAVFLYPRAATVTAKPPPPRPAAVAPAPAPAPARPAPSIVLPGPLAWEATPALSPAPAPFSLVAPFAARALPMWAT